MMFATTTPKEPVTQRWQPAAAPATTSTLEPFSPRRGDFDNAKKHHRRAVRLRTGATEEAYYNLRLIMRAEGNYRQAIQYFKKALGVAPRYAEAKKVARDVEKALKNRDASNKAIQADGSSRDR
ncbi:MAG: tetratricopeptide repeat protein [Planctomycetota bacterium]